MWIVTPQSCRSALASVDSILESGWRFEALERFVMWRGKQRLAKSWRRACAKAGWISLLCGQMSEPSKAQRGVDEWILSLRATPANRSAWQAKDSPTKTQDTCGQTLPASSGKYVQGLLFSKTSKDTSNEDSTKSSRICTNWGSMRSGVFIPRPKPEHPTDGIASSSWPTAIAGDAKSCRAAGYPTDSGRNPGTTLTDACRQWPTPSANSYGSNQGGAAGRVGPVRLSLNSMAKVWPASSHEHGPQAQKEIGKTSRKSSGLQLNPSFVVWLMGFDHGWTSLEPWATPSVRNKLT